MEIVLNFDTHHSIASEERWSDFNKDVGVLVIVLIECIK